MATLGEVGGGGFVKGPTEQFLKCGDHTHLFNWGEGLSLKMVKGTVMCGACVKNKHEAYQW